MSSFVLLKKSEILRLFYTKQHNVSGDNSWLKLNQFIVII